MRKYLIALSLSVAMALSLAACASGTEGSSEDSSSNSASSEQSTYSIPQDLIPTDEDTLETVCGKFKSEIESDTDALVKQFKEQAASLKGDDAAIEQLYTWTTSSLSSIYAVGLEQLGTVKTSNGDSESDYDKWASQLNDVYEQSVQKIDDAYNEVVSQ